MSYPVNNITHYLIDWNEIERAANTVAAQIKTSGVKYDSMIVLARGGFVPGRIIAEKLGINHVFSYGISFYGNSHTPAKEPKVYQELPFHIWGNTLVVDDIVDSGRSIAYLSKHHAKKCKSFDVASLFYKENDLLVVPRYFSEKVGKEVWIEFPYESPGLD